MFKELKGIEYALEVLRAFHIHPGQHDSKAIAELINKGGRITPSETYVAKILPRMRKAGLLISDSYGYQLNKAICDITVDNVLNICQMPDKNDTLYQFCLETNNAVSSIPITKFYDFT